jgi:hypothetical protein
LKHFSHIWLKPNCTWMFIRWSSTNFTFFVPVWNSKWRLRQDLSLTLDPMGKMFQNVSSLKPLGQLFGFNCTSGFREEAFWNIFPIGSDVKLSPAVAAIFNFISEQKT